MLNQIREIFKPIPDDKLVAAVERAWCALADQEGNEMALDTALDALKALCDKLDAITTDPSYLGMFSLALAHGITYTGPNWKDELANARHVLETLNERADS